MMNSQARKASPRCRLATATSTIGSSGRSSPTRCTTRTPSSPQRSRASATMSANAFSVMPG